MAFTAAGGVSHLRRRLDRRAPLARAVDAIHHRQLFAGAERGVRLREDLADGLGADRKNMVGRIDQLDPMLWTPRHADRRRRFQE